MKKNIHDGADVRAESKIGLAESRVLSRQTASPPEPLAVIVGSTGRTMVGMGPAGAVACRDGCHGVDIEREPRPGACSWSDLDKGNFHNSCGSITRLEPDTEHQTETPSDCHVEGAAAHPNPICKAKPDIRGPMVWHPRETSRDRPLNRGSCGRITPVTAENDLAAFLPFPWTRDQKEAKLCDGPRLPPSLNLDEPLDV